MRLSIRTIAGTAALAGLLFVGGSPAGAQDDPVDCGYLADQCADQTLEFSYPDQAEAGEEIDIEGNLSPVIHTPAVSAARGTAKGEGVSQASEVTISIDDEAVGTLEIDDDGNFEGEVTVPDRDPGDYKIAATTGDEPISMLPPTGRITAEGTIEIVAPGGGGGVVGDGDGGGSGAGSVTSTSGSTSSDPGSSSPLARTGFEQAPMITLGAAALVLGGAAVVGSRRRMAR